MNKIDIAGITAKEKLFHNEKINTYEKNVKFSDIKYWEGNLRTILAFEILEAEKGKKLSDIPRKEITAFLVKRDELKLIELANSIKTNGVRVPLIILDDGTLLDGNRRFFACSYLNDDPNKTRETEKILSEIPVQIIKKEDIQEKQKNKILAEANYVDDLKVSWSHDVKAKVISDYYKLLISNNLSEQEAYTEIKDVYSLDKSEVKAYIETIQLTEEYINQTKDKSRKFELREHVLKKFVYFWEFRNKAQHGRSMLDKEELLEVKPMLFQMVENSFIKNTKQVESIARAYRDKDLWNLLTESKGAKIDHVHAVIIEEKAIKSAEDKVRNFIRWLGNQDTNKFTKATNILLNQLSENIAEIQQ